MGIIKAVIIGFLVVLLADCTGGGPAPSSPSAASTSAVVAPAPASLPLDSPLWSQEYVEWPGTQPALEVAKLTKHGPFTTGCPAAGTLCEPFPDRSTGKFASYLLYELPTHKAAEFNPPTDENSGLRGYRTLSFTIQVIAPPSVLFKFDSEPVNTGATPAHIRAFFEYGPFQVADRWYSHYEANGIDAAAFQLAPVQNVEVIVPLQPQYWVDVNGQYGTTAAAQFAQSLANPQYVGLVCGGGSTYAHGCAVQGGTALLRVTDYSFGK